MKCPHCSDSIHIDFTNKALTTALSEDKKQTAWQARFGTCPSCQQAIIFLQTGPYHLVQSGGFAIETIRSSFLAWPQSSLRPCPMGVPSDVAADFSEAARVLPISPQASAALTRRCLQQVLRDYGNAKKKDLFDQIQEVIDQGHLSPTLAEQLDAVRAIGNFAAHPLKSHISGAILSVEPNEAEWNLDVLEDVFDHYFVKPAKVAARKAALNLKLSEAGKPPLR